MLFATNCPCNSEKQNRACNNGISNRKLSLISLLHVKVYLFHYYLQIVVTYFTVTRKLSSLVSLLLLFIPELSVT
jgi:hypothetical protein